MNIPNSVENVIYVIRGVRVILDEDLAVLYGVETKYLVKAVKRNLSRFPDDFMFELSNQEVTNLRSQFVISSSSHGGRRTAPYAFTEQGVAMLSSVLNSEQAIVVNVEIIRTFVKLRQLINTDQELAIKLAELEVKYDYKFKIVFDAIRELIQPKEVIKRNKIGFGRNNEK